MGARDAARPILVVQAREGRHQVSLDAVPRPACRAVEALGGVGRQPVGEHGLLEVTLAARAQVRDRGVEVVEMHNLLAETVAVPAGKKWILDNQIVADVPAAG